MGKRLATITVVIAHALAGCAQVDKYPETWEPLSLDSAPGRCPFVTGLYENNGVKPDGTKVPLASWLAERTGRTRKEERQVRNRFIDELHKAQVVELNAPSDSELHIHVRGDGISIRWTISKDMGQFECKDGAFAIRAGGNLSGDNVAALSAGSMNLYPGRGYLMVNLNETIAGVMLVVPVVAYEDIWARFPRAETK